MEKFTEFIEEYLVPPLTKLAEMRYMKILQDTFISLMSLLIIGSFFLLIAQLPVPGWSDILGDKLLSTLMLGSGVGTKTIGLYVAIMTMFFGVTYYNKNYIEDNAPMPAVILAVACFFLIYPTAETVDGGSAMDLVNLGTKTVFTAIIVSLVTLEIYRFVINKDLVIKLPAGVPPNIMGAFISLIPSIITISFWLIIVGILGIDVQGIIMSIFNPLIHVTDSLFGVIVLVTLNRGLWSIGIHGGAVVGAIADPITRTMDAANLTAAQAGETLPHIVSYTFFDQYVWIGLAPLAVALILCKSKTLKTIGWLGLVPALFNIGEPLTFGVPIVLNPLLMIPNVLSFLVVGILSYILAFIHAIPIPYLEMPWTLPGPIKAFLGTNANIVGFIWPMIEYVIMFVIWLPFVKLLDKQTLVTEQQEVLKDENSKESNEE
ncbi:PTS transporter subunit EIIC [Mollicutes bacterium LVI A0078]|nr:PTS transporter subunit EIIC [Mollicutes bacterium LVI A0075]WOO91417.1 PTS transporter subunit EIIC [Mollicutes bacterium LVI A0078]